MTTMTDDAWKHAEFTTGTPAWHAQQLARRLNSQKLSINWDDILQSFVDAAEGAIDQHIRWQTEKTKQLEESDFPIESSYHWAQRLMGQLDAGPRSLEAIADEFRGAMAVAVDEFIRDHSGQAMQGDTHASTSESLEEAQGQPDRISARSIIVRFMNGSEEVIHTHHPMVEQHGWTFRHLNGVPYLVIGHGIPRRHYPLCNIAFIELSGELL
jgi:hypothetical protein